MKRAPIKIIISIIVICLLYGAHFLYNELYKEAIYTGEELVFEVKQGESVAALANRLEAQGIIRMPWLFRKYIAHKEIDRKIHAGTFTVQPPFTVANIAQSLEKRASQEERTITILPGWTLRDIAEYFEQEGIATKKEVFALLGESAKTSFINPPNLDTPDLRVLEDKPRSASYEGYIAPDTYRVFVNASLEEIIIKLLQHRDRQLTDELYAEIKRQDKSIHDVIIMASVVEQEVKSAKDKAMVADLFWRRLAIGMAMQADSTVHYIVGKNDSVFTTAADRDSDSPWNTYKYPGLPEGPISNPSIETITATIYPEPNTNLYFLTTLDTGEVKYGVTLADHNANVQRYLR